MFISFYFYKSQGNCNFFTCIIFIIYYNKFLVYLVLCGSAIMGPHFGENQTFLLEGFPDDLEVCGKYTIRSKLYNSTEKNLDIVVPYNYQTQYEIWLSNNQPKLLGISLFNRITTQNIKLFSI